VEEAHDLPVVEANRRRGAPGLLVVPVVAVDQSGYRCVIWQSSLDDLASALRAEQADSNLFDNSSHRS